MPEAQIIIDLTEEPDDEARLSRHSNTNSHARVAGDPSVSRQAVPRSSLGNFATSYAGADYHRTDPSRHQYPSSQTSYPSHPHPWSSARPHRQTPSTYPHPRKETGGLYYSPPIPKVVNDIGGLHNTPSAREEYVHMTAYRANIPKKACVNCLEVHVACDGERPCSACVEPGLACYYPGEKPPDNLTVKVSSSAPDLGRIVKPFSANHRGQPRTRSPFARLADTTRQSDLSPNQLLVTATPADGNRVLEVSAEEENVYFDSDDSDDDNVLLAIPEFDEVKKILKKHEARMREHRAYLLQSLLNQSKIDSARAPTPPSMKNQGSPFQRLVNKSKTSTRENLKSHSDLHVQIKSHKLSASKKWSQMSVPLRILDADPTILPKYKSIGRLGASLLAPNIRTLKYWPYFPDEENLDPSEAKKNEELEERYQHDDNHLLAQRKCSELVDLWRPWVKDFVSKLQIEFSDILYWFLNTADKTTCDTCERDILAEAFSEASRLLAKPSDRSLTLARFSAQVITDVVKVSMWHFVLSASSVKDLLTQLENPKKTLTVLCSVCFTYNCLSHGAYLEPEESGGAVIMGGNIEINDEELNHNIKLSASVPNRDYSEEHQCGLYCVASEVRVKDILGRGKDGKIGGIHNHSSHVPRLSILNTDDCSEHCFWPIEKRTKFGSVIHTKGYQPKFSNKSKEIFKQLLRIYSDNQRAPCMIAKSVDELTCIEAFYYMLAEMQQVSHYRQAAANAAQQGTRKISKVAAGLDTTLSADLDERPPFVPCFHTGPCLNNPDCSCAQNKIHCEWFCGCDKSCDRRFPGCKCASANKTCFNDKNCECWKHNRECDPWLCGTCGVLEVLDPQNKYKDEIRKGRCKNNRIQLELPARTIKAPSEVQGWGLYAGADLEESAFIGEYKGETVGNQESDRRGAVYANIGQEYLFVMNRDQQIDGSNFGNKTRFINNSQRDDYINVYAKKLLCNGVQRVMLYAKRSIKAGEELLYNYNYPVSVTKKFWERGEGPTSVPGAVVAKPSITWTQPRVNGRFARMAGKQDGEQSPTARFEPNEDLDANHDEWAAKRDAKRKRASAGDSVFADVGVSITGRGKDQERLPKLKVIFPDDPDDSDFELVEASPSSESVEAAEASSDQGETSTSIRRRRIVHANDRRRGGLAQAKAWETRRKRNGKGK